MIPAFWILQPRKPYLGLFCLLAIFLDTQILAQDPKLDFFESKIRPVLVERCYECHSSQTKAGELGGKLRLDSSPAIARGGSLGPAILAGKPAESLLLKAIEYNDSGFQMPPDGKLSDQQIADFRQWIADGAIDPRKEDTPAPTDPGTDIAKKSASHWAYQPLQVPPDVPSIGDLGPNSDSIDRSIAHKLASKGLSYSPQADRRTLVRRLYNDLLGLPPTYSELEQSIQNPSDDWYVQLVDSLLQSPHFGERMARRWMDVARYADNKGYVFQEDREYPNAYKYRDWLIRSFNNDLPYNDFLRHQLNADRLDPENKAGNLDAMGMLTLGRRFLNNPHDIADDRIDLITRGLMGVTAACARCHDHKFDPVSMADYYSLHGAMLGSNEPGGEPSSMRLVDKPDQSPTKILLRGNPGNPGPEVPRRFFGFLASHVPVEMKTGSGRLELTEAIVDPKNPLTARVYVNRLWGWIFGIPLVDTPSDFGIRCDPPTQQFVLDSLAWDFTQQGWSTKKLIRRMVLSRTYKQQSFHREDAFAIDPENRLLWRAQRKRMDFESLRDALLLATGQLDPAIGGPSVKITEAPFPKRRTVYAYIDRQNLPQLFRTFDLASPDAHAPIRPQTTVPQQGLVLMNSEMVLSMLGSIGQQTSALGTDAGIDALFTRILARPPAPSEKQWLLEVLQSTQDSAPDLPESRWSYGTANFNPESGQIENFQALPRFHKKRWQGNSDELPDPQIDWAFLSSTGGHPGGRLDQSVVRRWTAKESADLRIRGLVRHPAEQGNGVRVSIILRGKEKLGQWTVLHDSSPTHLDAIHVEPGDTIDFVTDSNSDANSDTFEWKVRILPPDENRSKGNSERDFRGDLAKPLGLWEQAAQTLLLTNEFCFID
jgi:cytochrome c553